MTHPDSLEEYVRQHGEPDTVTVGEDGDFETVTEAVRYAQANGVSRVVITARYDAARQSTNEDYPIEVGPETLTVEGRNRSSCGVVVPDERAGTYAFDLRGSGSDYGSTHTLRDFYVEGGGIEYTSEVYLTLESLLFERPATHAIRSYKTEGAVSFSNRIENVRVLWGERDGIHLDPDAANHATRIRDLTVNRVRGDGAYLTGTSTTLRDSDFNYSGGYAVRIGDGNSVSVRDTYVEKSGHVRREEGEKPVDVLVDGAWNFSLDTVYCFSYDSSELAVDVRAATGGRIEQFHLNGYGDPEKAFVALRDGAESVDVRRNSHTFAQDTEFFLVDDGTDTMDFGS